MSSYTYDLDFISEENFRQHVINTIQAYNKALEGYDLERFNKNIVDPIKMTFDEKLYGLTGEQMVEREIARQREKSNTNAIGYFHQNIFKYFSNCDVPDEGFDVIFKREDDSKVYVEMKNKRNTINSNAAENIYRKMRRQLYESPVNANDMCYLVLVLNNESVNDVWKLKYEGNRTDDARIRKVSIDWFYKEVTGEKDAFRQVCRQLPVTIDEVLRVNPSLSAGTDTVVSELMRINRDINTAIYSEAFGSYLGFDGVYEDKDERRRR